MLISFLNVKRKIRCQQDIDRHLQVFINNVSWLLFCLFFQLPLNVITACQLTTRRKAFRMYFYDQVSCFYRFYDFIQKTVTWCVFHEHRMLLFWFLLIYCFYLISTFLRSNYLVTKLKVYYLLVIPPRSRSRLQGGGYPRKTFDFKTKTPYKCLLY